MPRETDGSAAPVISLLDAIVTRTLLGHLLDGVVIAAVCLISVLGVLRLEGLHVPHAAMWAGLTALGIIAASVLLRRAGRSRSIAAAMLERSFSLHNVVVTAEELDRQPERSPHWLRERVFRDAAVRLQEVDGSRVVPLRWRVALAAITVAALIATHLLLPAASVASAVVNPVTTAPGADAEIQIDLDPPAYSGLERKTLRNPSHVDALEGTHARITIASAGPAIVRAGQEKLAVSSSARGVAADVNLVESTYLAIEMQGAGGGEKRTSLIPVTVTPDALPSVRIDAPARDLLVAPPTPAIVVRATAVDDLALEQMSLHYTKVSGAGEQFEFVEGELPIRVVRDNDASWKANGEIALERLGLAPGDSLVYRVTARDKRPGAAGLASSDTYFVEMAGPGQVPLDGLDMPPERERYALSQQMVVLKIQRLRVREPKLTSAALQEDAGGIAAEQRAVRANLVFLMGGHVEDEEEEAEHSTDIQEGRLQNTAWREMSRAVGHMTSAEQSLIALKTGDALVAAKLAVESLQRAFGRSRYILRAVPARSRIDPSRRLSGRLDDARASERGASTGILDEEAQVAQALFADALDLASTTMGNRRPDPQVLSRLTAVTERALAVKGGGTEWETIARACVRAREAALQDPGGAALRDRLDELIRALRDLARASAVTVEPSQGGSRHLRGIWAAEARRR